jgi:fructose-1,6-bisphosphatase-3
MPAWMQALSRRYPTVEAALAEIANLGSVLTLPKGTVHVVSDVHGEDKKLRHILNNASGALRPRVERVVGGRIGPEATLELLNFLYYPVESWHFALGDAPSIDRRRELFCRIIRLEAEIIRDLSSGYTARVLDRVVPDPFDGAVRELVTGRPDAFVDALLEPFLRVGRDLEFLRLLSHVVRHLSVFELVVAGDLGDRGPRVDRVIELLMNQPNLAITWGNHDMEWLGACLGSEACIATVVRLSLRYGRLAQLEEGYGIPLVCVESLARAVYGDDPAVGVAPQEGEPGRAPLQLARMQKAAAILQFKLEGQLAHRHPEYGVDSRSLLHRISGGKIRIGGVDHPLLDTRLPTVDPADPYALTAEEQTCIDRLRSLFLASQTLWTHFQLVARRGRSWLVRDDVLIFHACVPVDAKGGFLEVDLDGGRHAGRALFDAVDRVVHRAVRDRAPDDLDRLYWLWAGPTSPMFGKDKMATFETYFLADEATHLETKNPYFKLINNEAFCRKVLAEFGADPDRGLIVNGHVPVKLDKGEKPLKKSGMAVTIDGAFSEAYGDRGYTLVLDPERTYLARHHHFESIAEAVENGADIIPSIEEIRRFEAPRTVGDTEWGDRIREEIALLEELVAAYRDNRL